MGAGGKGAFFPIDASKQDFKDLPQLPPSVPGRGKPALAAVQCELVDTIMKDAKFSFITKDGSVAPPSQTVPEGWTTDTIFLDSAGKEEEMEMNEGERKMEEKLKAKGKVTAWDLEFKRKYQMKKKQMELKKLAAYAKSLTGSDKMHPPIILKEESKDKGDKDKDK